MSKHKRLSRELYPYCHFKYIHESSNSNAFHAKSTRSFLYCMNILPYRLDIAKWVYIIKITDMNTNESSKQTALRAGGTLHPHPNTVQDEAFLDDDFFDPNDLVQVKYEMLRRHREEQKSVTEVAKIFGTSRQAFYAAKALFDSQGVPGLIPKRRGPRGAHKCTEEVLDFAQQWKHAHPTEGSLPLAEAVDQHFGISIHPRTIERTLVRRKKKRPPQTETAK